MMPNMDRGMAPDVMKVERGDSAPVKDEQEVKEEKKESGDTKEPESLVTSTDSPSTLFFLALNEKLECV